jgi:mycothiol system anti-sigma-R factor
MRCEECEDKLDRYVDRELTTTEALEVQLHLESCPDCMDHYDFEQQLRLKVKSSCDCDRAPKIFRDKLREILS